MMTDLKRICQSPTDEDKKWFPDIAGTPWLDTLKFAMQSFKDESFVQQFLSPKVMRDFKFFNILDDDTQKEMSVAAIHDEQGYKTIRQNLSNNYNLSINEPNIQIYEVNITGDRSLKLRHYQHNRRPLDDKHCNAVLKHLHSLWKFDIHLETVHQDTVCKTYHYPEPKDN